MDGPNVGKQFTIRLDDELKSRVTRVTHIRSSPKYADWNLGNSRSITRLIQRGLEIAERRAGITPPATDDVGEVPSDTSIRLPSYLVARLDAYLAQSGTEVGHKVLIDLLNLGVDQEERRLGVTPKKFTGAKSPKRGKKK